MKYCIIPLNLQRYRVPLIAVDAREKNSEYNENVRNTTFLNISSVSFLHLSIQKSTSQSVTVQTGFTGAEVKGWMDAAGLASNVSDVRLKVRLFVVPFLKELTHRIGV